MSHQSVQVKLEVWTPQRRTNLERKIHKNKKG